MKHTVKRILALFIALLLAMPGYAFADEPEVFAVADGEALVVNGVDIEYVEPDVGGARSRSGRGSARR